MVGREPILFIHLVSMGAYFMALGGESLMVWKARAGEALWATLLGAARIGHYAMFILFFTGGYLISGVKKEDRISFLITIGAFLILGALAGMASAKYKKATENDSLVAARPLAIRLALSAGILLLVSLKPDMVGSLATVAITLAIGAFAPLPAAR